MNSMRSCLTGGTDKAQANSLSKSQTMTVLPAALFPWLTDEMRSLTVKNTTRLVHMDLSQHLNRHVLRSPALQHRRIAERTYMDTMFATVPSFEGFTKAQVFSTRNSKFIYIKGLHSKAQVESAVKNFARDVGLTDELFADNAREKSQRRLTIGVGPKLYDIYSHALPSESRRENDRAHEEDLLPDYGVIGSTARVLVLSDGLRFARSQQNVPEVTERVHSTRTTRQEKGRPLRVRLPLLLRHTVRTPQHVVPGTPPPTGQVYQIWWVTWVLF